MGRVSRMRAASVVEKHASSSVQFTRHHLFRLAHKKVWTAHLDVRRNTPRQPVLNTLSASPLRVAQQSRNLGWAAQAFNQRSISFNFML